VRISHLSKFAGEEVPSGWGATTLGRIAKVERGKFSHRPRNDPRFYGGDVPFVQTGDVTNSGGMVRTHSQTLNERGLSVSKVFPKGTLLMTIAANIGDCAILTFASACPDSLVAIQPRGECVGLYLRYLLMIQKPRMHYLAPESAQKNINVEFLNSYPLVVPSPPEQRKIAEILSTWDRAIEHTEKLIEAKDRLKKGLMQRLLTGDLRFPEFHGTPWRTYRLGDVFKERKETGRDDLPLLSITSDRGVILRDEVARKDTSNADKSKYKRIAPGDIGYNTMRMWQGVSALSELEGIVSPAYTICVPKTGIDPEFARHFFKFAPIVHLFWRNSQGLVNDTLSLKYHAFSRIKVTIPSVEEQRRIAQVLSTVDREALVLRVEVDALQQQKKGLMQKLLTGKVRVSA